MSEWREKWPNGIPSTGQLPKSCYRMASKGIPLPWRWNGGTISLNLVVIWEMSAYIKGMTVRMAVAIAGGFTRRAKKEQIAVIRLNEVVPT